MDDLHYEVIPPTLALPEISERDKAHSESSSPMAPLAAFAIYLITSLPILNAAALGFAKIVLLVAAFGALLVALAVGVLGQRRAWEAEYQPYGWTTVLVEFSLYLIGFLVICIVAWRSPAINPLCGAASGS